MRIFWYSLFHNRKVDSNLNKHWNLDRRYLFSTAQNIRWVYQRKKVSLFTCILRLLEYSLYFHNIISPSGRSEMYFWRKKDVTSSIMGVVYLMCPEGFVYRRTKIDFDFGYTSVLNPTKLESIVVFTPYLYLTPPSFCPS